MKIRAEAPPEIQQYIAQNESFSVSGDPFHGEGGDYITETKNKHLKSNLSPGVPTLQNWVAASRSHKLLRNN